MQCINVTGFEPESRCDVSGKKGPCFVIAFGDRKEQRIHQTRLLELLRFLFNTSKAKPARQEESEIPKN